VIVSARLRRSARSRHSSRSSTRDRYRPNCRNLSNSRPSQHRPRSSHPGSSKLRRHPACQGWMRSRRVCRRRDEACPSRSHSRCRCSYVPLYSALESRPRSAHRQRRPGDATCHAVFVVSPTNESLRRTAVHPWPHLLSGVDWSSAPRVSARYREFTPDAIAAPTPHSNAADGGSGRSATAQMRRACRMRRRPESRADRSCCRDSRRAASQLVATPRR
jgi:hypothetical protein